MMNREPLEYFIDPMPDAERSTLRAEANHVVGLEVAVRAALAFVQERFSDNGTYQDGYAELVATMLRGVLRQAKT